MWEYAVKIKIDPLKIYGEIRYPDGTPAANIPLGPMKPEHSQGAEDGRSYHIVWMDSRGRFELWAHSWASFMSFITLRGDGLVIRYVRTPTSEVPGWDHLKVVREELSPDARSLRYDMELGKSTVLRGKVTRNHPDQGKIPVAGAELRLARMFYPDSRRGYASGISPYVEYFTQTTDENGEYRFEVGWGWYYVVPNNDIKIPGNISWFARETEIEITVEDAGKEIVYDVEAV